MKVSTNKVVIEFFTHEDLSFLFLTKLPGPDPVQVQPCVSHSVSLQEFEHSRPLREHIERIHREL